MSKNALRYRNESEMPAGMAKLLKTHAVGKTTPDQIPQVSKVLQHGGAGAKRANKYGAMVTHVDGIRFDSKREARYYEQLKLRVAAGQVRYFLRQVPVHLPGGTKLVVDFLEIHADGSLHYVDAKGRETKEFRIKRREVEHHYPIRIELV